MNILILTALEYPHLGGVSTHIEQLVKGLKNRGHHVDVLSRKDLSKIELLLLKLVAGFLYAVGLKSHGYLFFHKATGYLLYKRIEKKIKIYDTIHLHSPSFVTHWLPQNSYVVTCHAEMTPEMVGQNKIKAGSTCEKSFLNMEVETYNKAAEIICVDRRLRLLVEAWVARRDLFEMKNFIDVQDTIQLKNKTINNSKIKILCPRRLVIKNGVNYAIEAMSLLKENYQLLVAGDGEDEKKLKEQVYRLGLRNVTFLGPCSSIRMKELLNEVDIIVIPSITVNGLQEATSLAALEGFLYGVPVVASNIGGLSEMIIHERTGMLFEEKDFKKLADNIQKITNDLELYELIRQNALMNVKKNYSLNSRVIEIESIYKKAKS